VKHVWYKPKQGEKKIQKARMYSVTSRPRHKLVHTSTFTSGSIGVNDLGDQDCLFCKDFSATALFDKYFQSFSSKQLSDRSVKNEAYIDGNEDSGINSRWSAPIQ